MSRSDETEVRDDVRKELQTAYPRLKPAIAAERLWKRVFTKSDRERLGNNLEKAYTNHRTVGMHMAVL